MRPLDSGRDSDCGDILCSDGLAESQADLTTIGGFKRLVQEFFKPSRTGVLRAMHRLGHLVPSGSALTGRNQKQPSRGRKTSGRAWPEVSEVFLKMLVRFSMSGRQGICRLLIEYYFIKLPE